MRLKRLPTSTPWMIPLGGRPLKSPIRIATFAVLAFTTACASYRPILDDNEKYHQVGEAQAERDIDNCMAKADAYLDKHKSERMKKEAGRGAVSGAIIGGIMGAVSGGGLDSAARGGAVGAGVGAAARAGSVAAEDNLSPDAIKQNYVTRCLRNMRYDVIGWK